MFEQVWEEFGNKLLYYIKSKVSNAHDAEDILQNVYVKVFLNIEQLENKEAVKSWLYQITKNTIIDYYKKKKDLPIDEDGMFSIENDHSEIENMNDEIANCLSKMIFDLPDTYQKVYDMYENQEMKHKHIAEELYISVSASKVRLKRAKELFKKQLLDCCDFEVDKYGNIIDYKNKNKCNGCDDKC